ncbi:hypothetical protein AAFF_G00227670 [Aldrovandia affinis]|uniref:Capping protein regulator and myosin 1 linker 2 n=1 Tax=Aldrovandia affinis TaxID=143900 RepID=A0AAD7TBI3_9TELE|nr:hypothetical protein AAFF_G00227670 [Aldrovandia affinis]
MRVVFSQHCFDVGAGGTSAASHHREHVMCQLSGRSTPPVRPLQTDSPHAAIMASDSTEVSFGLQDAITQLLKPQKVLFMALVQQSQFKTRTESRVLVMTVWRAYMFHCKEPVKVESSFSYLEIYAIIIGNLNQVVIETDRQTYCLSLMSLEDMEAVVNHVTASLKKIFPDSSPGKLLKKIPPELQEEPGIWCGGESQRHPGAMRSLSLFPAGGFSETYAALCDFNDFPCREDIQWDVDNIYHFQSSREFNLLDFSHLDTRDVSLAVAALSFNQWFTKIGSKDFRLSPEVQEQVLYMVNRSPKLEEVHLENSGLKADFAVKMACALRDNTCTALHTINLSANQIEDKGVVALSQQLEKLSNGLSHLSLSKVSLSPKGLAPLAQAFSQSTVFSSSLRHLDLSGNMGSLATGEATNLLNFLSCGNAVSHLNLSETDCPLDALFVALSSGCCSKLSYLSLSRNSFSHRTAREVTHSVKDFFSKSAELKYVGLAGTRLPAAALRLLLQGLAINSHISDLELDLSSCELRSAGAQVIQEHMFEAKAISSLDLSDNGLESDMVTLVLSIGRSHSIQHLALGRNFAMKSRALTDVLHRIVQLIQEEECPLKSLSVSNSKLKTGTTTLINSLGSNCSLTKIDISGNCIGDTGAKMLAKALLINRKLRTLVWDRNNVTATGFLDVACALEKNFTLQHMSIPMSDVVQAYRSSPERTEEALQRIQTCLVRNSRIRADVSDQLLRLRPGMHTRCSEQMLHDLGRAPSSRNVLQHLQNDTARGMTSEMSAETQDQNVRDHTQPLPGSAPRTNIPQLRVVEVEFPTDEYVPVNWHTCPFRSIRPAPSVKSLLDVDSELQQQEQEVGGETALSVTAAQLKPGPSPPSEEDAAALSNSQPRRSEPASPRPPMDLPIEGQRLRHYTHTRPRPNRTNRQPPSRPQEQVAESENEQSETMGRVDEGVEEFFTKKIIPDNPLKSQREEPPVKAQPVQPASSAPSTGSSRNIKKKFGDFFAFKKVRGPAPIPIPAPRDHARVPRRPHRAHTGRRPRPVPAVEREKSRTLEKSRTPDGERKLKATRRSLREGKSQSLILLTGLDPDDGGTRSKKHLSEKGSSNEGPSSLEQRVQVMLHRMGVTKTLPPEPRRGQSKEGELRKADSEGTIIDSKPEPPPTFMKPRTMSTSSDMRRPMRSGMSALDSLKAVGLGERPALPERPGPLPPKPAAKPLPPTPEPPALPPRTSPAPPAPSPRRGINLVDGRDRAERAQSVTEETLPKPRPRMKPSPHRRAMSVHEESLHKESLREHIALLDPEELKAALPRLQRSPVRKRANLGELPPCSEDQPEGGEGAGEPKSSDEMDGGLTTEKGAGQSPAGDGQEDATGAGGETASQQHAPQGAEPSDQRTDPPLPGKHMN